MNDAIISMMQRYNCRNSEDLDFSLEVPDTGFDLATYLSYVASLHSCSRSAQ